MIIHLYLWLFFNIYVQQNIILCSQDISVYSWIVAEKNKTVKHVY